MEAPRGAPPARAFEDFLSEFTLLDRAFGLDAPMDGLSRDELVYLASRLVESSRRLIDTTPTAADAAPVPPTPQMPQTAPAPALIPKVTDQPKQTVEPERAIRGIGRKASLKRVESWREEVADLADNETRSC
jgi:hypothetical protein